MPIVTRCATMEGSQQKFHLKSLDGLRAIAILLVVWHHSVHYLDRSTPLMHWVAGRFGMGWNGVNLFFVLSGFLVGGLAFREIRDTGKLDIWHFWGRRFLRTWPLYYVILLGLLILSPQAEYRLWPYLVFVQNWFEPNFFTHSWSLAVEEQFYLLLPIVLWGTLKAKKNLGKYIWAGVFALCYWYRWKYINGFFYTLHTLSVVDSLLVGVGIGYLHTHKPKTLEKLCRFPNLLFLLAFAFVYGSLFDDGYLNRFFKTNLNFGGQAIGFGLLLMAALNERFFLNGFLKSRFCKWFALTSYSIYLTHSHAVYQAGALADALGLKDWVRMGWMLGVSMGLSFILGLVFYFGVEKPFLRLREKWVPRKKRKAPALSQKLRPQPST